MGSQYSHGACWVVDHNHDLWDALTWADELDPRTIPFNDVWDLVTVCQRNTVQYSRAIDTLLVFGHGMAGYQGMGAGRTLEESGTKSARYNPYAGPASPHHLYGPAEVWLSRLNGVLTEDATVLLCGCAVGEGALGDGLLRTLSKVLQGRAVQAFENSVYWWTGVMAGTLKTAYGDEISREYSVVSLIGA
jgi:hypothetical protein